VYDPGPKQDSVSGQAGGLSASPPASAYARNQTTSSRKRGRIALVAIGLLVIAGAAVAGWLVTRNTSSSTSSSTNGAAAVSASGLKKIADALHQPIYWAGIRSRNTYELTQSPDGRVYLRYLPQGVAVGSGEPYLTIGTYPVVGAYHATAVVAGQVGSVKVQGPNGAIAFYKADHPTNVYEAFPNSNFQIEVYSPSAQEARGLVASGTITPAGGAKYATATAASRTTATAASPADLKAASDKLGRPIYWVGRKAAAQYELTQLPDGRVYIRYLPPGVEIGADSAYLTVGTYPVKNAYARTKAAAAGAGSVKIPEKSGVAFYSTSHPTSVYVAYPGVDEQIEVYSPTAAQAKQLVAAGKVKPVS
jgi:hypothetical protein